MDTINPKTVAYISRGVQCAVCGWVPRFSQMIHRHHILPRSAGGSNLWGNLILLCPNHHSLAHAMFQVQNGHHNGPRTREGLIKALADPDAYYEHAQEHIRSLLR